ncbi:MAG: hydroxyethylthiazole kinase [Prolixibacteraceae bacterium]
MIDATLLTSDLSLIRERSPLIHNITNYVVMNNTANALLAIGASPVMAHSVEEVAEMAGIASSLVINIGTLSNKWIKGMFLAGKAAKKKGIPVILDPVGAGATAYRTDTCRALINECSPDIIRGNASEIRALVETNSRTKGVDSISSSDSALNSAVKLAQQTGAVVVVSGSTDYITDGRNVETVKQGSAMMTRVTGMGCTASALAGAFAAVNSDLLSASVHAMATMGITGELAAQKAEGPGTMQLHFLDILYRLDGDTIARQLKPA